MIPCCGVTDGRRHRIMQHSCRKQPDRSEQRSACSPHSLLRPFLLGYCGPGPGRGPMRSGRAVDVEADATALLVEAAVLVDPPSLERPRWREVARGRECQVSGMRRWRGRPSLLCRSGSGRGRRDAPRGCRRREVVWQRRGQGRARAAKRRALVEGCWARPRRRRRRGCRRRRRGTRGL